MFDDLSRSPMFMFSIVSTLFHGCTPQVPMVCQRFAEGIVWWPWTPVAIDPANGGSWGTWRTLGTRPTYHPSISQPEMATKIWRFSHFYPSSSCALHDPVYPCVFFYFQYHPHRSSALVRAWNHSKSVN